MFRKNITTLITLASLLLATSNVQAQEDMKGSADHPDVPRIAGTVIRGYAAADYDEGVFVTGFKDKKLEKVTVGGKRTRILYLAPTSFTRMLRHPAAPGPTTRSGTKPSRY